MAHAIAATSGALALGLTHPAVMVSGPPGREAISEEFRVLTRLGNEFQIRHHEVARHAVEAPVVDLLFVRALALVEGAARALAARTST